jgi:hypothetical protein
MIALLLLLLLLLSCVASLTPSQETALCSIVGFTSDSGDGSCAAISSNCAANQNVYNEIYGLNGTDVYCCACSTFPLATSIHTSVNKQQQQHITTPYPNPNRQTGTSR